MGRLRLGVLLTLSIAVASESNELDGGSWQDDMGIGQEPKKSGNRAMVGAKTISLTSGLRRQNPRTGLKRLVYDQFQINNRNKKLPIACPPWDTVGWRWIALCPQCFCSNTKLTLRSLFISRDSDCYELGKGYAGIVIWNPGNYPSLTTKGKPILPGYILLKANGHAAHGHKQLVADYFGVSKTWDADNRRYYDYTPQILYIEYKMMAGGFSIRDTGELRPNSLSINQFADTGTTDKSRQMSPQGFKLVYLKLQEWIWEGQRDNMRSTPIEDLKWGLVVGKRSDASKMFQRLENRYKLTENSTVFLDTQANEENYCVRNRERDQGRSGGNDRGRGRWQHNNWN